MILLVAATEMEIAPLLEKTGPENGKWHTLICGVGVLESAVRLSVYLGRHGGNVDCVLNLGVGGAYVQPQPERTPELLSLCLATGEALGDLGICDGNRIEPLPAALTGSLQFDLENGFRQRVSDTLGEKGIPFHEGMFVTVAAATGTLERGTFLQRNWNGLCENMEGASLARVCREYGIPMVELRAVSNLVEDRDPSAWKLAEACEVLAGTGMLLMKELV